MSGIVFYATENHDSVVRFYTETIGATVWLEQPDCTILQYENLLFGFCDREQTDSCSILTFVYDSKAAVDEMHSIVGDAAIETPHLNETYNIYQFFATDPDDRTVEFQVFVSDSVDSSVSD
ncbi:VOC family protein [Halorubraceae archaeon YAN]|nr:VOC family protein [Halorubraceae archaeon YAN]